MRHINHISYDFKDIWITHFVISLFFTHSFISSGEKFSPSESVPPISPQKKTMLKLFSIPLIHQVLGQSCLLAGCLPVPEDTAVRCHGEDSDSITGSAGTVQHGSWYSTGVRMRGRGPADSRRHCKNSPGSLQQIFCAPGDSQAVTESCGIYITVQCLCREGSAVSQRRQELQEISGVAQCSLIRDT